MEKNRNIALVLAYDGTRYAGWQRQEKGPVTIQGKLEAVLTRMYGEPVEIIGAGRTDAMVHAEGQVANFHLKEEDPPEVIRRRMNEYLPSDIRVRMAAEVSPDFHSRFHAVGKIYEYRISCPEETDVFLRNRVCILPEKLDADRMQEAADSLTGTHDYLGYCSLKKMKKSSVRRIDSIQVITEPICYDGPGLPGISRSDAEQGERIRIRFQGNGFLYHMVRILSGTLIEVGLGEREVRDASAALLSRDRKDAGPLAPAQGLTLVRVLYEDCPFGSETQSTTQILNK